MKRLLLFAVLALCACPPAPSPPPVPDATDATPPAPEPPPEGGSSPKPADAAPRPPQDAPACTSVCGCACQAFERYSCPEARPTARGKSCKDVCSDSAKVPNTTLATDVAICAMNARSLAELRRCPGVKCPGGAAPEQ